MSPYPAVRPHGILIVDDHRLTREVVGAQLDLEPDLHVVGKAASGRDAVVQAAALQPDLVVLDLDTCPKGLVEEVRQAAPLARVLVLSDSSTSPADIVSALGRGALGALPKASHVHSYTKALRTLARGGTVVPADASAELLAEFRRRSQDGQQGPGPLTEREVEVLGQVAGGLSNSEIGKELFISNNTVKHHLASIAEKLGTSTRVEAVSKAIRLDLLDAAGVVSGGRRTSCRPPTGARRAHDDRRLLEEGPRHGPGGREPGAPADEGLSADAS